MRSRLRGSANVGPYTSIVGFLREHGEVDTDLLATELIELQPDEIERYLERLAQGGAVVRDGEKVRLAD